MLGYFEVVIDLTKKLAPILGERKPNTLVWLVRATTAGQALAAAAEQEDYPSYIDIAQLTVRECKRYHNIVLNIPLTK